MLKVKCLNNEKGVALITSIMLLSLLTIIGFSAMNSSDIELRIAGNERAATQTFNLAEAGLDHAFAQLNIDIVGNGMIFSDFIDYNKGDYPDNIFLIDGSSSEYTLGNGEYQVFLHYEAGSPETITIRSEADGARNSKAVVEVEIEHKTSTLPPPPGALVFPIEGENVALDDLSDFFNPANSNVFEVEVVGGSVGGSEAAAIALTWDPSVTEVLSQIPSNRLDNYTCAAGIGPDCIVNTADSMAVDYKTYAGLSALIEGIKATKGATIIDVPEGSSQGLDSAPGIYDPKVPVIINGDATITNITGQGVLVVTGTLTFNGTAEFDGLILVAGEGNLVINGLGNGGIQGSVVVAKMVEDPDMLSGGYLGIPEADISGGGNASIAYDGAKLANVSTTGWLQTLSWKQE